MHAGIFYIHFRSGEPQRILLLSYGINWAEGTMKICIADSQSRVRYGLGLLLEQQPSWNVIGEAASANELIERVHHDPPDLVLIDWELPGMPLDALLKSLRDACPGLRVLSLSGRYELRQAALEAGADAFASKTEPPEKIILTIRQLMNQAYEIR
jgi:DNA-binding NarL/FixJ family response regulator